ncbi:MAG: hypothetical protein FD174_481 [Geobacteraceae bacterium]|nr:MAG: hypothetical protein FD174_481 [Geobacteraceae bacterium]
MKVNIKAALLSAFVLPGLGQLHKGDRAKGIVMIVLVNVFLLVALFLVMQGLGPIFLSVQLSGTAGAAKALEHIQDKTPGAKWLLTVFFGLWLYGVIDAAKGKEEKDDPQDQH